MAERSYLDAEPTQDYGSGLSELLETTDPYAQPIKLSSLELYPNAGRIAVESGEDLQLVNDRPEQSVEDQLDRIREGFDRAARESAETFAKEGPLGFGGVAAQQINSPTAGSSMGFSTTSAGGGTMGGLMGLGAAGIALVIAALVGVAVWLGRD